MTIGCPTPIVMPSLGRNVIPRVAGGVMVTKWDSCCTGLPDGLIASISTAYSVEGTSGALDCHVPEAGSNNPASALPSIVATSTETSCPLFIFTVTGVVGATPVAPSDGWTANETPALL